MLSNNEINDLLYCNHKKDGMCDECARSALNKAYMLGLASEDTDYFES